jgi:hypothetical protein
LRTCSICDNQSPDTARFCLECGADLDEVSVTSIILTKLQQNPRVVGIRIFAPPGACPACRQICGVYTKENVPKLPVLGCSDKDGCMNNYAPVLDEIYP